MVSIRRRAPLLLALMGVQVIALAQSVSFSIGSGSAAPGGTANLAITLTSSGGAQPAAVQWSFGFSSDIASVSVAPGSAATAAGKTVSCSGTTCIVFGLNNTVIPNGTIAVATVQIAASPTSASIPIQLTGTVASTATGVSIPSSGGSGTISLPPSVASVSCASTTINTPGSAQCTVSLSSAAPGGGFSVALSSTNSSLSFPTSITVSAGQTSATFTATAAQVASDQTATINAGTGTVKSTTLTLTAPAQLTSIACTPSTLGSNAKSTCTVSLNKAASSDTVVALSTPGPITIPANVTISALQSSATFSAATGAITSNQDATVTAVLNGQTESATIHLAAAVQPASLTCSPAAVNAPGSSTCTVALSGPAPAAGATVTITSGNSNVTVPGSILVGAGQTSGVFSAAAAAVSSDQTAQITANLNGASQAFTLSVSAPAKLSAVFCSPSTLGSNTSTACTVALNKAAAAATIVALAASKSNITVPGTLLITAGSSTGSFQAAAGTVTLPEQALITARLGDQTQSTAIQLTGPGPAQLSSVTCGAAVLGSNQTTTCTVSISAPAGAATNIGIASSVNSLTVPSSVVIASGQSSATFPASTAAVTDTAAATITASLNGQSASAPIRLEGAAKLNSLTCSPSIIRAASSTTCTVALTEQASSGGYNVTLASNTPAVTLPPSVSIPAGAESANFTAVIGSIPNSTAILTASAGGASLTVVLTLGAPAKLTGLDCQPAKLASSATATCTLTLDQPAATPLTVAVDTSTSALNAPASLVVGAGASSANFRIDAAVLASQQAATITVEAENSVQSSVSVMPGNPPALNAPDQITVNPLSPIQFTVAASDHYSLPLVLSVSGLPVGAAFDSNSGRFQWTPDSSQAGAFTIGVEASDSAGLSSRKSVVITVGHGKPEILGLYNAATYQEDGTCSPGSLGTLAGSYFESQGLQQADTLPWPVQLAGVHVNVNGTDAPILAMTDTLIQFQCPVLPPGTQVSLTVEPAQGDASDPLKFVTQEVTPGLFAINASNQGAVLIGGTDDLAMPATDGLPSRPAEKGEYLSIYANGLGPVQEALPAGAPAPLDHTVQTVDQVLVGIGGEELQPSFAGLAPGLAGLYQVNVQVPPDSMTGDAVPVYLKIIRGDGTTVQSNTVTVAIDGDPQ